MTLDFIFGRPKKQKGSAVSQGIKTSETSTLNEVATSPLDVPTQQVKNQTLHTAQNQASTSPELPQAQAKRLRDDEKGLARAQKELSKNANQANVQAQAQQIAASNEQTQQTAPVVQTQPQQAQAPVPMPPVADYEALSTKTQDELDALERQDSEASRRAENSAEQNRIEDETARRAEVAKKSKEYNEKAVAAMKKGVLEERKENKDASQAPEMTSKLADDMQYKRDKDTQRQIDAAPRQLAEAADKINNDPLEIYRTAERLGIGTEEQRRKVLEKGADEGKLTYTQMYEMLNPREEETPAQKAKREKREKRDAIIRSIGDGLSAIARIYFGSKGVNIPHDSKNDLTYQDNARYDMLRQEREKNKQAWQKGYQKAREMDVNAARYRDALAETRRHNEEIEKLSGKRVDQADVRLSQNQQKIDLSKVKVENDNDYKQAMTDIKQRELEGKLTHWEAQDAAATLRAQKAGKSSGGDDKMRGFWYQYYSMMDADPQLRTKVRKILRRLGTDDKVTNRNIKYVLEHLDDNPKQTTTQKPKNTTQSTQKPKAQASKTTKPSQARQNKFK